MRKLSFSAERGNVFWKKRTGRKVYGKKWIKSRDIYYYVTYRGRGAGGEKSITENVNNWVLKTEALEYKGNLAVENCVENVNNSL